MIEHAGLVVEGLSISTGSCLLLSSLSSGRYVSSRDGTLVLVLLENLAEGGLSTYVTLWATLFLFTDKTCYESCWFFGNGCADGIVMVGLLGM